MRMIKIKIKIKSRHWSGLFLWDLFHCTPTRSGTEGCMARGQYTELEIFGISPNSDFRISPSSILVSSPLV